VAGAYLLFFFFAANAAPATLFDALLVRPSRRIFDAFEATFLLVAIYLPPFGPDRADCPRMPVSLDFETRPRYPSLWAGRFAGGSELSLPLGLAIIAALLIAGSRIGHRWPVAIAGYVVLALAGALVVLGAGIRH
jgi:hypothetical protein